MWECSHNFKVSKYLAFFLGYTGQPPQGLHHIFKHPELCGATRTKLCAHIQRAFSVNEIYLLYFTWDLHILRWTQTGLTIYEQKICQQKPNQTGGTEQKKNFITHSIYCWKITNQVTIKNNAYHGIEIDI